MKYLPFRRVFLLVYFCLWVLLVSRSISFAGRIFEEGTERPTALVTLLLKINPEGFIFISVMAFLFVEYSPVAATKGMKDKLYLAVVLGFLACAILLHLFLGQSMYE